jgi:tetratricopeptide (TPR) repeat protein
VDRHRTLRAVVEWSWELLTEQEATLARRLAVFAGGATLPAIERVCDPLDGDPLDLLTALVDKSLVEAVETDTGEVRYRMLETIRVYATQRLADSGEFDALRDAHAAYHLELAELAEPQLRSHDQLAWLARLTEEHDNVTAALRHAIDAGDSDLAVRFVAALGWFWSLRGDLESSRALVREALTVPGGSPSDARRLASIVLMLADFTDWTSRRDEDIEMLRRLVREATPDDLHTAHPLLALVEPVTAILTDDNATALRAVTRRLDHPDPWVRAISRTIRGHLVLNDGDVAGAEADHAAAHELFRLAGDRWGVSASVSSVSELRELRGDRAGAIAALEESLRLMRELGATEEILEARVRLAVQRARAGDLVAAEAELVEVREAGRRRGVTRIDLMADMGLGEVALVAGDPMAARDRYRRALARTANLSGPPQMRIVIMVNEGIAVTCGGDAAAGRAIHRRALEDAIPTQDMPVLATVADGLAHGWAGEDPRRAATLMGIAGTLRGIDDHANPMIVAVREQVRAALGEAFDEAYASGAAMDRDAALAYCRG